MTIKLFSIAAMLVFIGVAIGYLIWSGDINYLRAASIRNYAYHDGYTDCKNGIEPNRLYIIKGGDAIDNK